MALRRSSENFRKTLCAALLIAVALLITPAAAAATADNGHPPVPKEVVIFIYAVVAILVGILAYVGSRQNEADKAEARQRQLHQSWNKRLEDARTRALETDNFSDTWVEVASRQKRDELLKNAATIERQEAKRQVYAKERETEYREIAAYAAERHGLDAKEVTEMLRKADELPYRLLQAAKKVKVEAA